MVCCFIAIVDVAVFPAAFEGISNVSNGFEGALLMGRAIVADLGAISNGGLAAGVLGSPKVVSASKGDNPR